MKSNDKLSAILEYAAQHSEYYRKIFGEFENLDISNAPILTKNLLYDNKEQITVDEYSNLLLKECNIHLTSGTVGRPVEIYWHYNDEMQSNISLWRLRNRYHNIMPSDKYCTLHTTNYSWNKISDYKKIVYSKDKMGCAQV